MANRWHKPRFLYNWNYKFLNNEPFQEAEIVLIFFYPEIEAGVLIWNCSYIKKSEKNIIKSQKTVKSGYLNINATFKWHLRTTQKHRRDWNRKW